MRSFDPKVSSEIRALTAIFSKVATPGTTIASCTVAASVATDSRVADPTPQNIISGSPVINALAGLIGGVTVPPGLAITQSVQGGVLDCTYVLTYTATMSDGQIFVEQVRIFVAPYVPFP